MYRQNRTWVASCNETEGQYDYPVAQLFPSNFDVSILEHSEAVVVQSFLKNLDESWVVIPSVNVTHKGFDREIDAILVSPDYGAYIVEVKGGKISIDQGQWKSYENKIKNPAVQATAAKHQLISRLFAMRVDISQIHIQHIVAFPDIITFPEEGAGPECPREIVFTKTELADPIAQLRLLRKDQPAFSDETLKKFLGAIRPDVREIEVQGGTISGVSQRIARSTLDQLAIVFGLDENKRVHIRGAAGTGKTFVATNWARRAVLRGERTLLVCYNRALGFEIQSLLSEFTNSLEDQSMLTIGSFHSVANLLLGENAATPTGNESQDWWDNHHADLLLQNSDSLLYKFDTIIIDEGQDFYPLWFSALESLLINKDTGRFFVLSDEAQAIYAEAPTVQPNVTSLQLNRNVRNTNKIANMIRHIGGAPAIFGASPGQDVDIYTVGGAKERRKSLAKALTKVRDDLRIPPSQTLVLVPHRSDITDLMSEPVGDFQLASWVDRDEDHVAIGTIHGTKGLERLAVILVNFDDAPDPKLTYIGASRAVLYLAVIGQKALTDQLSQNN